MSLNGCSENNNQLKSLLASWGLEDLFEHLKDEEINIEELKMMKTHHINELLCNFKLGTRIRFEYYLEKWRQNIYKPLVNDKRRKIHYNYEMNGNEIGQQMQNFSNFQQIFEEEQNEDEEQQQKTQSEQQQQQQQPQQQPRQQQQQQLQPPEQAPLKQPPQQQQQQQQQAKQDQKQDQEEELEIRRSSRRSANSSSVRTQGNDLDTVPLKGSENVSWFNKITQQQRNGFESLANKEKVFPIIRKRTLKRNANDVEETDDSTLTVLEILQSFGKTGIGLIENYRKCESFTPTQRTLLIQLIVNYFENNDYHLSLNTSYALENQILHYFPNEKLPFYRTEKRGKIYAKFFNTKRKRAEALASVSKRIARSQIQINPEEQQDIAVTVNDDTEQTKADTDIHEDSNDYDCANSLVKVEWDYD